MNIKFHENRFNGSTIVPCGRADGQTDMTKVIVVFCRFAKAPEMRSESLTAVTKKVNFFYKIKPWNPVEIYVYCGIK